MSTRTRLTQHKTSSRQISGKVNIPVLRLVLWPSPRGREALPVPGAKLLLGCNFEQTSENSSVTSSDYHNTITPHAWHRVVTHAWSCVTAIKTVVFLTLQSAMCAFGPAQAWPGAGLGQLQKSVSSPLSPPPPLSAIRLPLLLLQPITQASLCCAKSCSCSNTPGKSSLKHVRMRGPVW